MGEAMNDATLDALVAAEKANSQCGGLCLDAYDANVTKCGDEAWALRGPCKGVAMGSAGECVKECGGAAYEAYNKSLHESIEAAEKESGLLQRRKVASPALLQHTASCTDKCDSDYESCKDNFIKCFANKGVCYTQCAGDKILDATKEALEAAKAANASCGGPCLDTYEANVTACMQKEWAERGPCKTAVVFGASECVGKCGGAAQEAFEESMRSGDGDLLQKAKIANTTCAQNDHVACPGTSTMCSGDQCCPRTAASGDKTFPCPSAGASFAGCENNTKLATCNVTR